MSDTVVSLLTPPGTGAIATVEVRGPRAWELARLLFKPAGKPLPEAPEVNRFWFGTLGDDEVILAVVASGGLPSPDETPTIEVHCHGGRRIVQWVIDQFLASGGRQPPEETSTVQRLQGSLGGLTPARLLQYAPTLRTASILLDQLRGHFASAVQLTLHFLALDTKTASAFLKQLARFAPVGRHLIKPWKVVVAGAPNVGKSSLVNALAGYQRTVVSEVVGTTRDAVSVQVAFDGWPVELIDTAGMREAEGLEAEGIDRAQQELKDADLVLWVVDATQPAEPPSSSPLVVWNKADLVSHPLPGRAVSALTGAGIADLVGDIVARLVPHPPGTAVPFTPQLADLIEAAHVALSEDRVEEATRLLRDCLEAVS